MHTRFAIGPPRMSTIVRMGKNVVTVIQHVGKL